jgi:uncharacterized protein YbcV (DUF1398 family)
MEWSMWITVIATAVIALYALKTHGLAERNYQLAEEIKKANELKTAGDEEFREQISDLYRAIVVSALVATHDSTGLYSTVDGRIKIFREKYKGKTPNF